MAAFATPRDIPWNASLSLQCRVRHPSRKATVVYWTINARAPERGRTITLGDFGRWAEDDKASAAAALAAARIDLRVRRETSFKALTALVEAPYTPTLSDHELANAYDRAQAARGSDRRAYRR